MIDLLIPSRGRPERLVNTIQSAQRTGSMFNIIVYIDSDDERTVSYSHNIIFPNIYFIIGKQIVLSQAWNECFKIGNSDIVFHGSDDIIFETQDWDKIVIEHFKKHPESLLYGRDGHQDKNCPTHSFTSRSAADKIGYFVPPYFEADFNDVWLREVYTKANRIFYNPDLMIRHNHVNVDKKYDDDTYRLAVERRVRAAKVWEEKKHLIDEDVKKLLA